MLPPGRGFPSFLRHGIWTPSIHPSIHTYIHTCMHMQCRAGQVLAPSLEWVLLYTLGYSGHEYAYCLHRRALVASPPLPCTSFKCARSLSHRHFQTHALCHNYSTPHGPLPSLHSPPPHSTALHFVLCSSPPPSQVSMQPPPHPLLPPRMLAIAFCFIPATLLMYWIVASAQRAGAKWRFRICWCCFGSKSVWASSVKSFVVGKWGAVRCTSLGICFGLSWLRQRPRKVVVLFALGEARQFVVFECQLMPDDGWIPLESVHTNSLALCGCAPSPKAEGVNEFRCASKRIKFSVVECRLIFTQRDTISAFANKAEVHKMETRISRVQSLLEWQCAQRSVDRMCHTSSWEHWSRMDVSLGDLRHQGRLILRQLETNLHKVLHWISRCKLAQGGKVAYMSISDWRRLPPWTATSSSS